MGSIKVWFLRYQAKLIMYSLSDKKTDGNTEKLSHWGGLVGLNFIVVSTAKLPNITAGFAEDF